MTTRDGGGVGKYTVVPHTGPVHHTEGQWWHVQSPSGHRINLRPMARDDADHTVRVLEGARAAWFDAGAASREGEVRALNALVTSLTNECDYYRNVRKHNPDEPKWKGSDVAAHLEKQTELARTALGAEL
jgi:hypothetical protein